MFETLAQQLVQWLHLAPVLVSFAGAFIGGTVVMLVLATFAGSAGMPWWPLLLGAFFGNYMWDITMFAGARSRLANGLRDSRHFAAQEERIDALRSNYRKRDVLFFVAIKFAYGLRTAQLLLLGAAHYPWGRFLAFDAIAVLTINLTAILAGWMFGRGVTRYMDLFENAGTFVSALCLIVIAWFAGKWLVNRCMLGRR